MKQQKTSWAAVHVYLVTKFVYKKKKKKKLILSKVDIQGEHKNTP